MTVYYNEFDPSAAAILRGLIADDLIPFGVVDERSIEDVVPTDLRDFVQCHFFAGVGGWALALRLAGVADSEPLWTASCPCQPFSAAGEGAGFADERHLWPSYFHLVAQCRPDLQLGEQVASTPALEWIDLVRSDLEAAGYACTAVDLCAAGAGAPHIRQRLFWLGHTHEWRRKARHDGAGARRQRAAAIRAYYAGRDAEFLADAERGRLAGWGADGRGAGAALPPSPLAGLVGHTYGQRAGWDSGTVPGAQGSARRDGGVPDGADVPGRTGAGSLAHADGDDAGRGQQRQLARDGDASVRLGRVADGRRARSPACELAELRGTWLADEGGAVEQRRGAHWAAAEWLACSDGKARPVEPGIFPLAHGIPGRVGVLRGAGNAISPPIAAEFVEAFFEGIEQ